MKSFAYLAPAVCLFCLAALPLWFHRQPSKKLSQAQTTAQQREDSAVALSASKAESAPDRAVVLNNYGKLPLSFEANQGQADPRVKFLSYSGQMTLLLTPDEALIAFAGSTPKPNHSAKGLSQPEQAHQIEKPETSIATPPSLLRMRLIGANPATEVRGVDELPGKSNYFIGNDPKKWRTNLPNYGKVRYGNLYRGVDLVFYGHERQLEYDFVVSPGGNPGTIQLSFEGTKSLRLDGDGNLVLNLGREEVSFRKPVVYQPAKDGDLRRADPLVGAYVLDHSGQRVSFKIASYDPHRTLVIDPILSFSTFLGGSQNDTAVGIAVDTLGNSYVAGNTSSPNFPVTPNSFQTTSLSSVASAFITKLNPSGTAPVYSTYLGGTASTNAAGIAIDPAGEVYVAGLSDAADFPVTPGAYLTTGPGSFVTKLNASGSALIFSTFLTTNTTNNTALPAGVTVDSFGNAYVVGSANTGFPVTPGAFQTACPTTRIPNSTCAFVTKLNSSGTALTYSTLLGGSGNPAHGGVPGDSAMAVVVDSAGSAYVTGEAFSTDFPVTSKAFQAQNHGGSGGYGGPDAFVTKLSPDGTSLEYSTYLGGSQDDVAYSIAVDPAKSAYVTGYTASPDFPIIPGAFQNTISGLNHNGFISKFSADGSALVYSTFLGGNGTTQPFSIALDSSLDTVVTGNTQAPDFPQANPLPGGYVVWQWICH
jgi:hypothetical protein